MHTSGLILKVRDNSTLAEAALLQLTTTGPFTLGERRGGSQAAVLETTDPNAAQHWHEWAESLAGIEQVEVVFVHWDESEEGNHAEP